ncbi:MAG TPA: hypothetical protein VK511_06235 [Gemmatimonadaceae bacterium]|nr:hypothetical protein [Gemmatimonadaceae bacterium]
MSVVVTQDSPPLDLRLATERPSATDQGALALWFGLLGPSFLVLLNLEIGYALTPWACRTGDHFIMIGATALIFVVDLLAGLGAARHLQRDWIEDTVLTRPAFTAMLGVLLSALGAVVIIAQWMPTFYLRTCQ